MSGEKNNGYEYYNMPSGCGWLGEHCHTDCGPQNCGCPECCPEPVCPPGTAALSGIQVQLSGAASEVLESSHNVLFDTVINQPGLNITYNSLTGEFMLPANKNYFVSWWAAVDGTGFNLIVEFSVVVDGNTLAAGVSPPVTCQVNGTALVSTGSVAQMLTLQNTSKNSIRYANSSRQANIVIIELVP